MNFAIYQSYVKEPLKFFAPSVSYRRKGRNSNTGPSSPRHARRLSMQAAPLQLFFPNEPLMQTQEVFWQKPRTEGKTQRISEIHLKKIEIIFEESLCSKKNKKLEEGESESYYRVYRPNSSNPQESVRKNYRPVTVNPRYFRKVQV